MNYYSVVLRGKLFNLKTDLLSVVSGGMCQCRCSSDTVIMDSMGIPRNYKDIGYAPSVTDCIRMCNSDKDYKYIIGCR